MLPKVKPPKFCMQHLERIVQTLTWAIDCAVGVIVVVIMHCVVEHFLYLTGQGSNPDTHVVSDNMFTAKAIHSLQLGDFILSTK